MGVQWGQKNQPLEKRPPINPYQIVTYSDRQCQNIYCILSDNVFYYNHQQHNKENYNAREKYSPPRLPCGLQYIYLGQNKVSIPTQQGPQLDAHSPRARRPC